MSRCKKSFPRGFILGNEARPFHSLATSFVQKNLPQFHRVTDSEPLTRSLGLSLTFDAMNLNYEQRLQVVAKMVLDDDARADDAPPCEEELGLRATLKPHQVEGVSWLIRRYKLGVNVVLGELQIYNYNPLNVFGFSEFLRI